MTEKKKSTLKTIKDVVFAYTSVTREQKQLNKENKPALSDNPLEFHSWEVKILISDSKYKVLKKAFKGAKNFPNVKEYTAGECVEKGPPTVQSCRERLRTVLVPYSHLHY